MGNRWGRGKGNGEEKGGRVRIQPTRDQSGRESHHDAKEGFQESNREIQGIGSGISKQKGIAKGWGVHLRISC